MIFVPKQLDLFQFGFQQTTAFIISCKYKYIQQWIAMPEFGKIVNFELKICKRQPIPFDISIHSL